MKYAGALLARREVKIYMLLTKREGRTGRISARDLDSMDRAQQGPYKKDRGPIFSQYDPEQAWLIRDLLHDWIKENLYTENWYPEDFVKTMSGKNFKEKKF